ncbi:hypothetical protein JM93_01703 [Roseibium hamelinense]|uniref:Antibiotic biosynthesis monooxygenase n=1 Tax=Roseibium hamelinense TaxID=150831 RepID=A0A562T9M1_9HYPH|nr:hypothetical protein [Roseibium hamelinense]MTI42834.1 hypothetical protein [Roseibium hamelinense]TWI89500.1 hypothetical protein JM93_01703 [Roseibium hamelinense]
MSGHCLELVVFKVKNPEDACKARRAAQDCVKHYDGFLSWTAYEDAEGSGTFADIVSWRDLSCAKAAAKRVVHDPGFKAIMAEIDGLITMGHYTPDRTVMTARKAA